MFEAPLAEIVLVSLTVANAPQVVSYIPQIVCVARCGERSPLGLPHRRRRPRRMEAPPAPASPAMPTRGREARSRFPACHHVPGRVLGGGQRIRPHRKEKAMSRLFAMTILIASAVGPAASAGLEDDIALKAATCWTTQAAMRGVRLAVDLDVGFDDRGGVETVVIAGFVPETETGQTLAQVLAAALKACGPYAIEGQRQMSLRVNWLQ